MKFKSTLILLLVVCFAWLSTGYHAGPAANSQAVSGAPFNSFAYCTSCHFGGTYNPTVSVQLLSGSTAVTSYTAGNSYTVHIVMTAGSNTPSGYGFQVTCAKASNFSNINNWGTLPANTHNTLLSSHNYVEQSATLSSGTVNIPWTAPTSGTGTVKFYLAGNLVNGDLSDYGDSPARDSLTVTESVSCTAPSLSTTITDVTPCYGGNNGAIALTVSGGTSPFTYAWTGPGTYTANTQNISGLSAGTYKVVVTATGGCKDSVTVNVSQPTQVTVSASSNAPICVGTTLYLLANSAAPGATYSWTGPNSFASSNQNPSITNATTAASGTYSVIATSGGCSSPATTVSVNVDPIPAAPTVGSNSPVCAGSTLNLSSSSTTPGVTYSWSGPNSFASSNQNPAIPNITTTAAGTYSVVAVNGCSASSSSSLTVTVNSIPTTPTAGSNSPLCVGDNLNLTSSGYSSSFTCSWTGPNSFTSSNQNPTISNVTTAAAGTYSVTVSDGTCTSAPATVNVIVNPVPAAPTTTSNSPVCTGNNLNLNANSTTSSVTYSWTGPNSFTSTTQNPTITNVTTAASGTYSVTASLNGCTSSAGTTNVTVNQTPSAPVAGSNSPLCTGSTLNLTSSGYTAGAICSWTGPNSFTSSSQNPFISNTTTTASGTYSVTSSLNGCTSAAGTVSVTVKTKPSTPSTTNNSPLCSGTTLHLTANSSTPGVTYSWTGPNSFTSSSQNPSISSITSAGSGIYIVTATLNGCTSNPTSDTVSVLPIQPPPTVTASANLTTINSGQSVTFTANITNGGSTPAYQWYKNGGIIAGATSSPYTTSSISNGDVFKVKLTTSVPCAVPDTATSSGVIITVISTGVKETANIFADLYLYPNPNNGNFSLDGRFNNGFSTGENVKIQIANVLGQVLYHEQFILNNGVFTHSINLPNELQSGLYFLHISTGDEQHTIRLVLEK